MASALWACYRCERIGPEADAERHMEESGHPIVRLSEQEEQGVRTIWAREGRDQDGHWRALDLHALSLLRGWGAVRERRRPVSRGTSGQAR